MGWTRGSLALPRMNAHRLVIVVAALTTMVAAALATAGVRLRRAENALLAAFGVPPRAAAAQLCLENSC
jgi:hypothetical protein